jgi:crotonobetaine/carnitine-CoA ligase
VPSPIPGGEDEVVLALVRANGPEGETLDSKAVYDFADKNLPRFARPRYLRFISELPKTANGKVQRAVLRKDGTRSANDRGELSRVSSD